MIQREDWNTPFIRKRVKKLKFHVFRHNIFEKFLVFGV